MKTLYSAKLLVIGLITFAFNSTAQLPGSGNAYDFNSSYISAPNAAILNSNYITLEAWIKADSWANNVWENVIISKDGWQSGDAGYTLRSGANGTLSFNISIAGSWVEVTSASGAMVTGQWYHVAGTYDGTTMRIYINGVEVGTSSVSGNILNDTYDINIGKIAYTVGGTRYFDGMIDEVRVWSEAIPQSSIQDYMCEKVTAAHPQYASLSGYWKMDDVGTIIDSSPNGNNATNSGAVQVTSGAAIGDKSIHNYGGGSVDLTLDWTGVDSVQIESSSALQTIHLYRVDQDPNTILAASGIDSLNHTHYYGVFGASTGSYNYDLTYYYGNTPMAVGNETYLNLAGRNTPNGSPWAYQGGTVDPVLDIVTKNLTTSREVLLALACPSINLNYNASTAVLCGSETLDVFDQAANSNYQWHDGNGPITGANTNALTITSSESYYLVANDGFCADTSGTIVVTASASPAVAFGTINPFFCDTDPDFTVINASPAGGNYSGTGMTGNVFSPTTATVGQYTLYYNYTDGVGCSGVDSTIIDVNVTPTVPVIVDNNGTLCVSNQGTSPTFIWYLDGGVLTSGLDTCFTVTTNGDYTVEVTYGGCVNTSLPLNIGYIGLEETLLASSISITPNPTDQFVTINAPEGVQLELVLTDAQGRILQERSFNGELELDLGNESSGVYFMILNANGEKAVKRIVKN